MYILFIYIHIPRHLTISNTIPQNFKIPLTVDNPIFGGFQLVMGVPQKRWMRIRF